MSADKNTTSKSRVTDLIVVFVLILIFALLLEQTIRFYLFGTDSLSYHKMKSVGSMGYTGYLKESDFPDVVYEFKPNIDSYFKLADFKTNSEGLRDKEYRVEKPEDTFRVAVVGGSFTVPAGVELDQAFHTILEERFNNNPDLNYEFINFGVSGYRINNKIATLKHKALKYDPDLVLFILDGSQFTKDREKEFIEKPKKNQFFQSFTYKFISKNKLFKKGNKNQEFLDEHMEGLTKLDQDLKELSVISKRNNIPICVVVLDHNYSNIELSKQVEELVNKNDLYFSNTLPSFADKNISDLVIYKIDIHPNSKANQIFAEAIYRDLTNQSLMESR